jgi:glycosyltransferase involved in cell wall biosynthesis
MAGKEVRAEDGESRPNVLRPVMFPWFRPGLVSEANQWLLKRAVWKALHAEGRVRPAVLVSTLPIVPSLFESDWFARSIYYRVDDFASWEGVSERTMRALEKRTLEACDVMIAASTDLLRIGDDRGKRTALLTHGVDLEHFAKARTLEPPTGLARLPKPVIGTFGIFDARTDGELLVSLARRFSGGSIVILGPIDRSTGPFRALKNIHFIGKVPYAKLPEYVASFDACILPYLQSQILSPLKLKEYLATGKPVVSTPLQEAVRWRPHLTIADRDRFCDAVDAALGKEGMTPELFRLLREESWERKADAFLDIALDEL